MAIGRRIEGNSEDLYVLGEESIPYSADFASKNEALSPENTIFWDDYLIVLAG